jgi:hypothetical protein
MAALRADTAGPAVPPAVVDVLGEQSVDRFRLVGQERDQGFDRAALTPTHAG